MTSNRRRPGKILKVTYAQERPNFIPDPLDKAKGSSRAGLHYEARVVRYFRDRYPHLEIWGGYWFEYTDEKGTARCSPDLIIWPEVKTLPVVIGECKLTCTKRSASTKLRTVYAPVVGFVARERGYTGEIRIAQICHNLRVGYKAPLTTNPDELFREFIDWDFITLNLRK